MRRCVIAPPSRLLVTGASPGGIGGAICRRLVTDAVASGQRPRIVISCLGGDSSAVLGGELDRLGASVMGLPGDLADPAFPEKLAKTAAGYCGGLDLVVSNAGRSQSGPLAALDPAGWDAAMDLHAKAAWLLAKAAFPHLEASRGSFVATGSITGTMPNAGRGAYPVAKAALIMLCKVLAAEWAPAGVRVNAVSPGLVGTQARPKPHAGEVVPLGRAGTPEDVAGMVAFLASADAGFITGQNIVIDGGLTGAGLDLIGRWPHG